MCRIGMTICLVVVAIAAGQADAQSARDRPTEMNFDMWCQEQRHLPAERCDRRRPRDEASFEAYRSKIEKYETIGLQRRGEERRINRAFLHYDPVDHPIQPSAPPSNQPPR